ncbi:MULTISPECIES: hypothetical protein [unclassified Methylobacterium]|uniref:hypothetical protein n=1 Tax=unclassified Methylobacterium TaxID=2615210 RepID=UPI0011C1D774|nr:MULTISPECIES: hypothetical protein [unclassified Methylobacterium]QEE40661.1 hypothetical protein FVA80_18365 [Methylobacterium sp. WL1]TXN58015.1 hypothetical protein FV241_08545 [Methylobacterium sp. WL2]
MATLARQDANPSQVVAHDVAEAADLALLRPRHLINEKVVRGLSPARVIVPALGDPERETEVCVADVLVAAHVFEDPE